MDSATKEKEEKLKADLFSTDENVVLKALTNVGEDGSRNMVEPVLELLAHTESEPIQTMVLKFLSELKISDVEHLFIEKLENPDFNEFKQELVSCMWNSGLNPINDLHILARLACEEEYMTALEVLTLIENMEGPFDHDSLTEAFNEVSFYITEAEHEDPKLDLVKSLYEILYAFQENN
jgi:hypothetical protein